MEIFDQTFVIAVTFLIGFLLGMFFPFVCIWFYNLVGINLGDMLEDDGDSKKESGSDR